MYCFWYFRACWVKARSTYSKYYEFYHKHAYLFDQLIYEWLKWNKKQIEQFNWISIPGFYATCILLELKLIVEFDMLEGNNIPIINAISGVSESGRTCNFNNFFCEGILVP